MSNTLRRFAPVGLYVALAALLAAGGIYIVMKSFNLAVQISLGVAVLGVASFIILDTDRALKALTGRQARYGSNALVLSLAVIGVIIIVNYLAINNPVRWDVTEDKVFTLSPETISIFNSLKQPVMAQAFYTPRTPSDAARKLLESYKFNSNGKFDYKFIDPEADIAAARAANITRDGTIVIFLGDQKEQVSNADEQSIDSAIIRLNNPGQRVLYFLTGHGEFDPNGTGAQSYSQLRMMLENKNYQVRSLSLLENPKIPDDALTIIIGGPKKPLSNQEVKLLKDYLAEGHSVVNLSDSPYVNVSAGTDPATINDPMVPYLGASWGIDLVNDIIIDPNVNPPYVAVASSYGSSPITNNLNNMATVFPTARSAAQGTIPGDVSQRLLASTSSNAWGETDFQSIKNNNISPDQGKDVMGPVPLAIAAMNTTTNARLVVIGDAVFATDQYFNQYANSDFLINSIDWAASQENLINLTPKTPTQRLLVPPEVWAQQLIMLGSIFIIPGLVLVIGVTVWIQRRRRG
jgi:ABC-type uncharacterized transport system involved in gliding motility auxiliary subunit